MTRFLYALIKAFKHYGCLSRLKQNALPRVVNLTSEDLSKLNIECLALDFDGVLNAHAELRLHPDCEQWLKSLCKVWPEDKIVILSNKPHPKRIAFFNQSFPNILFVPKTKKKPYPDGLLKIAKMKNISADKILLVDDRLLTGMLACCIAGSKGILIKKPYKRLFRRPIRELFFIFLRTFERLLIF